MSEGGTKFTMDSINGWFLKELEFSRLFELNELFGNSKGKGKYENIPNKSSGIYIYYNKDKIPVYVGKAKDLRSRHSQHMGNGGNNSPVEKNRSNVVYYSFSIVDDVLHRNVYEMLYIGKHKPDYNSNRDTCN